MAAALTFNAAPSGGQKCLSTVTGSLTGLSSGAAYVAVISLPNGHSQVVPFTASGTTGSFTFVPPVAGTYSISVTLAVATAAVTATLNIGGHG